MKLINENCYQIFYVDFLILKSKLASALIDILFLLCYESKNGIMENELWSEIY